MLQDDVRWKQRFQNYSNALGFLEKALAISNPSLTEKAGIIQFFEMSLELAWNVLKDYLTEQGFAEVRTPREAIKKSFETGLIEDGQTWMNALKTET